MNEFEEGPAEEAENGAAHERHPGTSAEHPAPPTPESAQTASGADVDVLVVGGGIQGAGVLQAAAAEGWSAALLERSEAAIGTSSRSSKLIHGGLRYLESYQFSLVRESLRERKILRKIAPHLVRLVPFHIPVYGGMARGKWTIRAGLTLYALLGGLRKSARFRSLPRSEWDGLDGLETSGLKAVFRYYDGQTDDAALCRAVLASAIELGALCEAGARVTRFERRGERWRATYVRGGEERFVDARVVVNATGPWANSVAGLADPGVPIRAVDLVAGTHVEIEGALEKGVYYTEAPSDGRAVFSIPWKGRILVGTTEEMFAGDPAEVRPTEREVEYLLGVHREYFPGSTGPVLDAWAGLRVLLKAESEAFDRPRDVVLETDRGGGERLSWVTVYGGKLTGYRHTAQEVLDEIRRGVPGIGESGRGRVKVNTATLPLPVLEDVDVWDRRT